MMVHCKNCNKDFPIMEIDSNFHSNGYCIETKIDWTGCRWYERYGFEAIIGLTFIVFFVVIMGLTQFGFIEFSESPEVECMSYHIGTVVHGAGNNLVTYNSPKEICDVELLKIGDSPRAYKYSYEVQEQYKKTFGFKQYTCDGERLDFNLTLDKTTMNLICPDGSIAKMVDI